VPGRPAPPVVRRGHAARLGRAARRTTLSCMDRLRVVKGHGTENDFVIVPDFDGVLELTPELARALCDRHSGIGADGVLRAVRCENDPVGATMAGDAVYFMDYRNADGSVAEMCGNGVRVFVLYLQSVGVVVDSAAVAAR